MSMLETGFDVVAVNLRSSAVRVLSTGRNEVNAEAIVMVAVARRGVEEEFFSAVPSGMYADGDVWRGNGREDEEEEAERGSAL